LHWNVSVWFGFLPAKRGSNLDGEWPGVVPALAVRRRYIAQAHPSAENTAASSVRNPNTTKQAAMDKETSDNN
jgi:hypothetical protein